MQKMVLHQSHAWNFGWEDEKVGGEERLCLVIKEDYANMPMR
jgi:hypothetical protein